MRKEQRKGRQKNVLKRILECRQLYLLLLPAVLFYIMFQYVPMYGITIAFKKLSISKGFMASPFAEPLFFYFDQLFKDPAFWNALKNTLIIGVYKIIFTFPVPIIIAVLLNEVRNTFFKKTVQTIIYLPRFISWTIMAGIIMNLLSVNGGVVNNIITFFGGKPANFLMDSGLFRPILVITSIFKDAGWSSIVFFAAISNLNPELYEACKIDGGGRWAQIRHITLPGIKPIISIMLILTIGNILVQDTQQVLTLYSPNVYSTGDILGSYIFRTGIGLGRFSFSAAATFFNSVISLILILTANLMSKKLGDQGLF